jgi:hypothetical protein
MICNTTFPGIVPAKSGHSSFLYFDHLDDPDLGKTTLPHLFAPSRVE